MPRTTRRRGCPWSIVDFEDRKIGLGVDRVLGTREIVIKSLSRHYREIEGLIGASILGNGQHRPDRGRGGADPEALSRGGRKQSAGVAISLGEAPARPQTGGRRPGRRPAAPPPAAEAAPAAQPAARATPDLQTAGRGIAARSHGAGPQRRSHPGLPGPVPVERQGDPGELPGVAGGRADRGGRQPGRARKRAVGGIYVGIAGELAGGVLMVLPERNLLLFHELLHRRPPGTCAGPQEVDVSAIGELGNILAASFINAMADETRLALKRQVPEISVDMCLAVIDSVLARFNQPGDRLLLTRDRPVPGRVAAGGLPPAAVPGARVPGPAAGPAGSGTGHERPPWKRCWCRWRRWPWPSAGSG